MHRQLGAAQPAGGHRRDTDHEAAPAGQPGQQGGERQADPSGARRCGSDGGELGVLFADDRQLGVHGPEGDQLRRTLGEVDHRGAQVATRPCESRFPAAGRGAR